VWLDRPAWMMIGMFTQELKGPLVDLQLFTPTVQPFARRQPTLQKMQFYAPPTYRAEGIVSVQNEVSNQAGTCALLTGG
jgi:hypothetical protein